jgi:hypothetical protein
LSVTHVADNKVLTVGQSRLGAFSQKMQRAPEGLFARLDFREVSVETEKLFIASSTPGNAA